MKVKIEALVISEMITEYVHITLIHQASSLEWAMVLS